MINYELLKKLCQASGVAGNEDDVRNIIISEIKDYVEYYKIDALGNIIALKKGKNKPNKKLMLSAHMDEVGFIITDITQDGLLKFTNVGGIDSKILGGKSVLIGKNKINGVIGMKPIHLLNAKEKDHVFKINDLYIDIGASNKKESEKYVSYGDFACFNSIFEISNNILKSKAIDDRVGCYILIQMIKSNLPFDMYFTFNVQEEIGLIGAKTSTYAVNPDSAIVIEATTASDTPNNELNVCKLNNGAVISFMDKATIYNKEYFNLAIDCAKNIGEKYQIKNAITGGNDSGSIHQSREGVKTIALSLPCRYLHSPHSIISLNDLTSVQKIALELSEKMLSNSSKL